MQRCLRSRAMEWVMNIVGVILAISIVGGYFFLIDWWRRSYTWFKIAGGYAASLEACMLAGWLLPLILLAAIILYYWRGSDRHAKRYEQRGYGITCVVIKVVELLVVLVVLLKASDAGCDLIWSDFDRVKDSNPVWIKYRPFIYSDDASDEQAMIAYEKWKDMRCLVPSRVLLAFYVAQCITSVAMGCHVYLTSRSKHRPLETEHIDDSGYRMELLSH